MLQSLPTPRGTEDQTQAVCLDSKHPQLLSHLGALVNTLKLRQLIPWGEVAHTFSPNTQETEAGGFLEV